MKTKVLAGLNGAAPSETVLRRYELRRHELGRHDCIAAAELEDRQPEELRRPNDAPEESLKRGESVVEHVRLQRPVLEIRQACSKPRRTLMQPHV